MKQSSVAVVQCWDDGMTADVRLIEILRQYDAKATFNINIGRHTRQRKPSGWTYRGVEVELLGLDEMRDVYDGFEIANHGLNHLRLEQLTLESAHREILGGRLGLETYFEKPILGFVYPNGIYSPDIMDVVRSTGHVYARTTRNVACPFPPENAMAFHPSCHFLARDLWSRYEDSKSCGVFYFWGHSSEIATETMWKAFEDLIARIAADPDSHWENLVDLFHTFYETA